MSIKPAASDPEGFPEPGSSGSPTEDDLSIELQRVLLEYLTSFDPALQSPGPVGSDLEAGGVVRAVTSIFDILTHRRFCHLSRRRSEPYRDVVEARLRSDVSRGRAVQFYYDLGPGYHASVDLKDPELSFEAGLGEMVALRQVVRFLRKVQAVYPPGARFWLVIDNLCGWATNDIPLEKTEAYVLQLRRMIEELGLAPRVAVLAESELNSWETYRARLDREPPEAPPEVGVDDVSNVIRFLGRPCGPSEAAARIELYRRTGRVTEELLAPAIDGVRLTQRATPGTLGFRAFSGGDQRIQAGRLAMGPDSGGRLRPILITTQNATNHDLRWLPPPQGLPSTVQRVLYAGPLPGAD